MTPFLVPGVADVFLDRVASRLRIGERAPREHPEVLLRALGPQLEDGESAIDQAAAPVVHAVPDYLSHEHLVVELAATRELHPDPAQRLDDLLLGPSPPLTGWLRSSRRLQAVDGKMGPVLLELDDVVFE